MPFGANHTCSKCNVDSSSIWRKIPCNDQPEKEEIICNDCSIKLKKTRVYLNDKPTQSTKEDNQDKESDCGSSQTSKKDQASKNDLKDETNRTKMLTRKSTRNKRGPNKSTINNRNSSSGKGRRHIFKRNVYKSPASIYYPMTRESVYHNGIIYQVGDIVSLVDADDGSTYFAQIRGFLQDQFCDKSAAITWLVPNLNKGFKPISEFSPADYILGPEEDYLRRLECMEFVCRSPSDYFKASNSPYATARPTIDPQYGYIYTRLGPVIFDSKNDKEDDLNA